MNSPFPGARKGLAGAIKLANLTMHKLQLSRFNDLIYRVLTAQGEHVGNLKWINGVWKFKAIGYAPNGDIIPGGGPLTDQHNTAFATLDETEINAQLRPD